MGISVHQPLFRGFPINIHSHICLGQEMQAIGELLFEIRKGAKFCPMEIYRATRLTFLASAP